MSKEILALLPTLLQTIAVVLTNHPGQPTDAHAAAVATGKGLLSTVVDDVELFEPALVNLVKAAQGLGGGSKIPQPAPGPSAVPAVRE